MIRYIKNINIDKARWDRCISASVNGNIYAYSWYLDSVCDHWDALVAGDYDTVFPLTWRKKFGYSYLYQPSFSQQLGIFYRYQLSPETVRLFLENIPQRFKLVEIQLNTYNTVHQTDFSVRMRPNLVMDLIQPYDIIRKHYSQNLSRNLRKALESQWVVHENITEGDIIKLFRANRGKDIDTLSASDYDRLTSVVHECRRRNQLQIVGVGPDSTTIHAGAVFVRSHNRLVFLFSATDRQARDHGGMPMIIDHVIRENAGSETILDFEGSENPDLARFYRSFGAQESSYPFIQRKTLGWFPSLCLQLLRSR